LRRELANPKVFASAFMLWARATLREAQRLTKFRIKGDAAQRIAGGFTIQSSGGFDFVTNIYRRTKALAYGERVRTVYPFIFLEFGTKPHRIVPIHEPRNPLWGSWLMWRDAAGRKHFARRVFHPGTWGRGILRDSMDATKHAFVRTIREIVLDAVKRVTQQIGG